jgi:hypothetical protein
MIRASKILESIKVLMGINERIIANLDEIDDFIDAMLERSPNDETDTWLRTNLRNYLIHDHDYAFPVKELPDDAYHYKALDVGIEKGEPVYIVRIDTGFEKDINLILDLHASGQGPKTGNWKYMSVPDAIKKGRAWKDYVIRVQNGQAGIELYKTYSNGHRWVEVLDEVALAYEAGQIKGTCLIDAKRWMQEFEGGKRIFSLRDSHNRSRVQIIFFDKGLRQAEWIVGRTGRSAPGSHHYAVDPKDYEYCYDFLNEIKPNTIGELSNIGGAIVNGKVVNKEGVEGYLPKFNELLDLLKRHNYDKFESYIDQGIDINLRDDAGYTFLISLCYGSDQEPIRYVLDAGIDVNARNEWGDTALHVAAEYGKEGAIKLLLDAGAAPRIKAIRDKDIPLHRAYRYEDIKILLDAGSDADTRDSHNRNPLYTMIKYHKDNLDPKAVELLLRAGADPNASNKYGDTPLLILSKYPDHFKEVISLLKEYGAKIAA